MSHRISAVILNYRTPREAVRCVRAMRRQTVRPAEIFVVDNRSEDESVGYMRNALRELPDVRIVENRTNAGFAQGNNLAFSMATGDIVLVTNPDNELSPDAIERMLAVLDAEPDVGLVAPKLIHEDGTIRPSARRFPHLLDVIAKRTALQRLLPQRVARYLQEECDPDVRRDVDWVVGACLLVRRTVLDALGGFDPRFFLFFEDMDFCRRCWNAGWRVVYLPSAVAADRKRRLSDGSVFSMLTRRVGRAHIKSALQYFWKWRFAPLPRH